MAFWEDTKESVGSSIQKSLYCDTEADVANLPTSEDEIGLGSTCLVIESSNVYILGSNRTWEVL